MTGPLPPSHADPVPAAGRAAVDRPAADRERAYAANLLGALAHALTDRLDAAGERVVGHGATAPAALVSLYWYPGRPVSWLSRRLRISQPGAVQLAGRLHAQGLVDKAVGPGGRTRPLSLSPAGTLVARAVLQARQEVLFGAVDRLGERELRSLTAAVATILGAVAGDLLDSEHVCRLCDEGACPDARCPVEGAVPSPQHRRGTGYGVHDDLPGDLPGDLDDAGSDRVG